MIPVRDATTACVRTKGSVVPRPAFPAAIGDARVRLLAALLLGSAPAAAAPARVATVDLCADELALLLAAPGQLVSVSRLAADPRDTRLAPLARTLHHNRGTLESVVALRPDLIIASGRARHAAELAPRLGARMLVLPPPATLDDVRANTRLIADALGRRAAGERLVAAFDAALGPPRATTPALLLQGGGWTPSADGLAAAYLRRAGFDQRPPAAGRVSLEALLVAPPPAIVESRYRADQPALPRTWLDHPAFGRLASRRLALDGRAWTCLGPLAALDLAPLRRAAAR